MAFPWPRCKGWYTSMPKLVGAWLSLMPGSNGDTRLQLLVHGQSFEPCVEGSGTLPPQAQAAQTMLPQRVPEATPRPCGQERKRVWTCILAENEEVIVKVRRKRKERRKGSHWMKRNGVQSSKSLSLWKKMTRKTLMMFLCSLMALQSTQMKCGTKTIWQDCHKFCWVIF